MESVLHRLPRTALESLARALASGRVQPPYSALALADLLAPTDRAPVTVELARLAALGMTPRHIAETMDLLAAERARQQAGQDRWQIVWTGPDQKGPSARDTSVVARELLSEARHSLLITTFSLSRDERTFEPVDLAMRRNPDLDVTIILHVEMARQSLYGAAAATAFARDFWTTKWPWPTRPKVYYDPRGVHEDPLARALQHAKCIVADLERVLITSANYTESGHLRNIELGVVVHDPGLAVRVDRQFRTLITNGFLTPLPT